MKQSPGAQEGAHRQCEPAQRDKHEKRPVVSGADALADPRAVMVVPLNTDIAQSTMRTAFRPDDATGLARSPSNKRQRRLWRPVVVVVVVVVIVVVIAIVVVVAIIIIIIASADIADIAVVAVIGRCRLWRC